MRNLRRVLRERERMRNGRNHSVVRVEITKFFKKIFLKKNKNNKKNKEEEQTDKNKQREEQTKTYSGKMF